MRKYGRIGASYTDDLGRRLEALEYSGGSHDADHVTHLIVKGAMMRIT